VAARRAGWLLALGILLAAGTWVAYQTRRETPSAVTVWSSSSSATGGRALLVYHPGLSDFQEQVMRAFAEGLAARGWRVELATASSRAPTALAEYDLLAVGGPTYFWAPARSIQSYVGRLGDLGGKQTAVLITGAGAVTRSRTIMERLVREHHGEIVVSLALTTLRPNDAAAERAGEDNRRVAERIARDAAARVALPARGAARP
jgi:flavorubredoxin